ncbi:YwdI family protein [Alkalibacillus haloalkaliphilus]|uniref:Uncharacterized protein n=1 Tax=Alkalibacillus haloalkaliphilus TaxID=94136 RepID=A0A511VZQ9_9BACI|nr:YwdI family protein [Alkalibacillus haloalkaliphilus]GEN44320.1 hypothetical protein AHA02nite_00960 [Alkalibacillus haloalkaliphilus]
MTISYEAIVEKMKNELQSIDPTSSQSDIRAKMYAIRSLADVVLASDDESHTTQAKSDSVVTSQFVTQKKDQPEVSDIEAKMMGIEKNKPSFNEQKRLKEEDANGDSLFDF